MDLIKLVHQQLSVQPNYPVFKSGDSIVVSYKIIEGAKERIQDFKGDVIQVKGSGAGKTFTVRKISNGVGVERIFPFFSPSIVEIKLLKKGKVRRARLFYLRDLVGKKAKIKEKKAFTEYPVLPGATRQQVFPSHFHLTKILKGSDTGPVLKFFSYQAINPFHGKYPDKLQFPFTPADQIADTDFWISYGSQ